MRALSARPTLFFLVSLASAAAVIGCALIAPLDFDTSRPTSDTAPPSNDDAHRARFTFAVRPATLEATLDVPQRIQIVVERAPGWDGAIEILAGRPGDDVEVHAGLVPAGATSAEVEILAVKRQGRREVALTGTSAPDGESTTSSFTIDVRGKPGSVDTSFGDAGVLVLDGVAAPATDAVALELAGRDLVVIGSDALHVLHEDVTPAGVPYRVPGVTAVCVRAALDGGLFVAGDQGVARLLDPTTSAIDPSFGDGGIAKSASVLPASACRDLIVDASRVYVVREDIIEIRSLGSGALEGVLATPSSPVGGALISSGTSSLARAFVVSDQGPPNVSKIRVDFFDDDGGAPPSSTTLMSLYAPASHGGPAGALCHATTRPARRSDGAIILFAACGTFEQPSPTTAVVRTDVVAFGQPDTNVGELGYVFEDGGRPVAVISRDDDAGGFVTIVDRQGPAQTPKPREVSAYDARGATLWSVPLATKGTPSAAIIDRRRRLWVASVNLDPTQHIELTRLWL